MDAIQSSVIQPATTSTSGVGSTSTFADMGSDDFFRLLIMQLRNQDPLEPMGNEELLRQIASVREIELSTTLTDSLKALTGQQRYASASALIGQYVATAADSDGGGQSGVVVAVRFQDDGTPMLQLAGGTEVPLGQVARIQAPLEAAESMVGMNVVGIDRSNAPDVRMIEGIVTGVREDESRSVVLELDNGKTLRLRDVERISAVAA